MNDALGDRIKSQYEDRTRYLLPRRTYTIIRVDGKAFHTLTRGFNRPYDKDLAEIMDYTARRLCEEIQGAKFAFVQSDEISVLVTDFEQIGTCAWFDGNVQKMVSIAAAVATASFNEKFREFFSRDNEDKNHPDYPAAGNKYRKGDYQGAKTAYFDARVFTIPDHTEVENYFIWRQNDASRNSVQMAARAVYSHKALEGKSIPELHDLLHEKGINWNDYTTGEKRGRVVKKEYYAMKIANSEHSVMRGRWTAFDGLAKEKEIPIFTQDRTFLKALIPLIGQENA